MFLDGDWRAQSREIRCQYEAWVQGEEEKFSHLCQGFSINMLVINISLQGRVVEKPKTRNRSRGHPDNKLLGEKATWGQRLQQSTNGRSFAERFYKSTTRRHEQGRLLPRGFAQGSNGTAPPPRLPGGNILKSFPSVGYQEDPIFMRLFHYREDWKTRWWRPLPTWRRGKLFGGKQLLRQSQSDLEILRRGGQ